MIRRVKILWFNYRLMRCYANSVPVSWYKAWCLCQGKKVRVHPGRRATDVQTQD